MEAIELRKKTNELEKQVKVIVEKFIDEVGICNINITTDFHFVETVGGVKMLVNAGVRIYVTI